MTDVAAETLLPREFARRREGMIHAMNGGLWFHRHIWQGRAMAHVVSTDRDRLLTYGRALGLTEQRLQFKRSKDPRTLERRDAWHWDLGGPVLEAALRVLHVRRPPDAPADTAALVARDGSVTAC
jgi:hypothetical protein